MVMYDLEVRFGSQKSFYGKAIVIELENGNKKELYSYDTLIATIDYKKGTVIITDYGDYSNTTVRHLKDFLLQNDVKPSNIYISGVPQKNWSMKTVREVQNKPIRLSSYTYF